MFTGVSPAGCPSGAAASSLMFDSSFLVGVFFQHQLYMYDHAPFTFLAGHLKSVNSSQIVFRRRGIVKP
jgi:hypothetical protein